MDKQQTVEQIISCLGGAQNIAAVTNCMTRLRVVVKSEDYVDESGLKLADKVLGLVHDRSCNYEVVVGPGNSRQFADICHEMGMPSVASSDADWKANKAAVKSAQKDGKVKRALKVLGDIFIPLIPGIITAGLCAGFASLITQLVPNYKEIDGWYLTWQFLSMINLSFMAYITAWAGYRAAERLGATPILGGMLGMITSLSNINEIAAVLGLYNAESPLMAVLRAGKGGVLAVIAGVFILAIIEKFIRKRMPASLDIVFTPLLTLVVCVIPYVLVIMPLLGFVSSGITWAFSVVCLSDNAIVRVVSGYVAAAVWLPMVAAGMHHGMVALYSVQLQELGFVTLYPALCMAGAGQVGACLAIYGKAKRLGHKKLCSVIGGALPAGFLGVGEPLIYGVTLPMGKPFITAGLGAGFGGAFVMLCQVASTTWGPSGLLGLFVMTAGEGGAVNSVLMYGIGLLISYVAGYLITRVFIEDQEVAEALDGIDPEGAIDAPAQRGQANSSADLPSSSTKAPTGAANSVQHGDKVDSGIQALAVADGELVAMADIPDSVFAEGTLGPCFGIMPSNGNVYAPAAGEVAHVADTGHSMIISADDGRNLLLHVGIDTVKLGSKAFEHHVKAGDHVEAGQLLLQASLDMIEKANLSPIVIVIELQD